MTEIDDPLARFYDEEQSRNAGIKNPITGIREPYQKAEREAKRNDEIKRKSQIAKHVLTQLMEQDLGREWLYDLLNTCNVFGTPYTVDTQLTAYNAGAMFVGKMIEGELKKYCPKNYFTMCEEGWNREKIWDDVVADKA
jgi:hypothetical protein